MLSKSPPWKAVIVRGMSSVSNTDSIRESSCLCLQESTNISNWDLIRSSSSMVIVCFEDTNARRTEISVSIEIWRKTE